MFPLRVRKLTNEVIFPLAVAIIAAVFFYYYLVNN